MHYSNHHYNKDLKLLSRKLRTNSVSVAEKLLCNRVLSKKQLKECRFLRQPPISNYNVDFFCPKLFLIIEFDGNSHLNKGFKDLLRENDLEKLGYRVVRIS